MYCTLIWGPWGVGGICGVFTNGFLIPVKELGLLTNLNQWIRGLDVAGALF
jgi:hypothetical protein